MVLKSNDVLSLKGPPKHLKGTFIWIFWNTTCNEKKGKEEYLYSAIYILCISQSAQAWITHFYVQIRHACLSFMSVHQMAPPLTEVGDIKLQLTTHLSTRRDERLSWHGWLTYSGRFTHISGYPSATRLARHRRGKVCRPKTDVLLPLCHAINVISFW